MQRARRRRSGFWIVFGALAALAALGRPAAAGEPRVRLTLKDGRVVPGRLVRFDGSRLTLRRGPAEEGFAAAEIQEVRFLPPRNRAVGAPGGPARGARDEDAQPRRLEQELLQARIADMPAVARQQASQTPPVVLQRLMQRLQERSAARERSWRDRRRDGAAAVSLRVYLTPLQALPALRRDIERRQRPGGRDQQRRALARALLKAIDERVRVLEAAAPAKTTGEAKP